MNKIEEIKEYISLLENSSLSVLEIEKEDGTKIHLEKEHPAQLLRLFSHRLLWLSLPLPRKTPRL